MSKVNCSDCMKGNCLSCRNPDACLCADTDEHKEKFEKSEHFKTFTDSGLCDELKIIINKDSELISTIDTLWTVKHPTFLWDPSIEKYTLDAFLNNEARYKMALRRALREIAQQRHPWMPLEDSIEFINNCKIQFTDSKMVKMGEWGPQHSGLALATDCVILQLGERETYTVTADARCFGNCGSNSQLEVDPYSRKLQPPPRCAEENCSHYGNRFYIEPKSIKTEYCQKIMIQEPMEEAKNGSPIIFECELTGDDVYDAYIGQRKRVIGVFTSVEQQREASNKILIKCASMSDGVDTVPLMPETSQIIRWTAMAKDSDSYMKFLIKSFAPELYKDDQTALSVIAILMSLVRGTTVDRLRGDIHTLLVGDPSLGKTKLLEFLILITQKSAYVNGRMASGPGLTIGMDTLPGGKRAPRAGAIPLCDEGFVAMDEMGRMKKDDITAMHESMESGFISFTKAAYNFKLKARTTIIGAANPVSDVWDEDLSVTENINLPITILSRMDFIVNLRDMRDDLNDQYKMQHVLKMRRGEGDKDILNIDEFTKLLNYVRMISPKMTKPAEKKISDFFHMIRKVTQEKGSRPIDTRLSESLIRISTAIAKLHFSQEVTETHAEHAIELVKKSFHTLNMNVEEGQIIKDTNALVTTKEQSIRKCASRLEAVSREEKFFPYDDLIDLVLDKEPEQFDGDKNKIIAFVDKHMEKMFLRRGTNLRLATN